MPELPEVETVRRTLRPHVLGRRVERVFLERADVVRNVKRGTRAALGEGATIRELLRHGKQLAILFDSGRAVHVHLGMSGQLYIAPAGDHAPREDHVHVRWALAGGQSMHFRDPRRFGGVWAYPSLDALRLERWNDLGPDALGIRATTLRRRAAASRRAIKACLLDQAMLAGVGNIYADEALFLSGIHPLRQAGSLTPAEFAALAANIRRVLRDSIKAGGSSLRDFLDAERRRGVQQTRFHVYGREGKPCPRCTTPLASLPVAGRTSTFCPRCQRARNS